MMGSIAWPLGYDSQALTESLGLTFHEAPAWRDGKVWYKERTDEEIAIAYANIGGPEGSQALCNAKVVTADTNRPATMADLMALEARLTGKV